MWRRLQARGSITLGTAKGEVMGIRVPGGGLICMHTDKKAAGRMVEGSEELDNGHTLLAASMGR